LLGFLAAALGHLQWEDSINLLLINILLLTWKTILLVFDGTDRESKGGRRSGRRSVERNVRRARPMRREGWTR